MSYSNLYESLSDWEASTSATMSSEGTVSRPSSITAITSLSSAPKEDPGRWLSVTQMRNGARGGWLMPARSSMAVNPSASGSLLRSSGGSARKSELASWIDRSSSITDAGEDISTDTVPRTRPAKADGSSGGDMEDTLDRKLRPSVSSVVWVPHPDDRLLVDWNDRLSSVATRCTCGLSSCADCCRPEPLRFLEERALGGRGTEHRRSRPGLAASSHCGTSVGSLAIRGDRKGVHSESEYSRFGDRTSVAGRLRDGSRAGLASSPSAAGSAVQAWREKASLRLLLPASFCTGTGEWSACRSTGWAEPWRQGGRSLKPDGLAQDSSLGDSVSPPRYTGRAPLLASASQVARSVCLG
mmetsp:Transcript_17700/g.67317  ORF Transcript_17700/g.67317 Transcript_17700/m.67317 type:complete len:355 (+) Transcript_17700:1939-3003(+)